MARTPRKRTSDATLNTEFQVDLFNGNEPMHFLLAIDADADVRRVTDFQFAVERDANGVYLVCLRTRRKVQIMQPARHALDFTKVESLSRRERQVFEMLGDDRTMNEIATHMLVSVKTAETYRARIKDKLDADNGPHLLRFATEWHLLTRTDAEDKASDVVCDTR